MRDDVPSLRSASIVHEIERTFSAGCARPGFRLVHYSLQINHAHIIVEAVDRDALGRGMKAIGSRLARAVNRVARRTGRVLTDRYHHSILETPRKVRSALRYVLLNARRHAAAAGLAPLGSPRPRRSPWLIRGACRVAAAPPPLRLYSGTAAGGGSARIPPAGLGALTS